MHVDPYATPTTPPDSNFQSNSDFSPESQLSVGSDTFSDQPQTQTLPDFPSTLRSDELEKSWGYLEPLNKEISRVYFSKTKPKYLIGRLEEKNAETVKSRDREGVKRVEIDVPLDSKMISYNHCTIVWEKMTDLSSSVVVRDTSRNGTSINSYRIRKGESKLLRDGNVIQFGQDDRHRYTFHLLTDTEEGFSAKYEILRELGKGTFASVDLALHRPTGRRCAVKTIRRARMCAAGHRSNPNDIVAESKSDKFLREISILRALEHPNICKLKKVYEFMDDDGGGFRLILEYVKGGDLMYRIIRTGGLCEGLTRHITQQVCLAMAYLHSKKIAHRDLKPENILLTESNPPSVKVTDFGLAKMLEDGSAFRTTCGTPHYQAPEIILRDRPDEGYTMLVDSYSVGVIVFCMLANAQPYTDDPSLTREERVKARVFDWETLSYKLAGDYTAVKAFISELVATNTADRMTLTQALKHTWLLHPSKEYGNNEKIGYIAEDPYASESPHSSATNSQSLSQPEIQEQSLRGVRREEVTQVQLAGVCQGLMGQECQSGMVDERQKEPDANSMSVDTGPMEDGMQSSGIPPMRSLSFTFDIPGLYLSGQTPSNISDSARSSTVKKHSATSAIDHKSNRNGERQRGRHFDELRGNNTGKRKEIVIEDSDSELEIELHLKGGSKHEGSCMTETAMTECTPFHSRKRNKTASTATLTSVSVDTQGECGGTKSSRCLT